MYYYFAIVFAAIYCSVLVGSTPTGPLRDKRGVKLRCNHPASTTTKYAHYFTHCCGFGEWTQWAEWTIPDGSCTSGKRLHRSRNRKLTKSLSPIACATLPLLEESNDCELTLNAKRLMAGLGLGSANKDLTSVHGSSFASMMQANPIPTPHGTCRKEEDICQNIREQSVGEAEELSITKEYNDDNPITYNDGFNPFGLYDFHRVRDRRQTQPAGRCKEGDIQHILFVLDSSGSIGDANFKTVKKAIGELVPYFCKKVQVGLVTFSSTIKLEFCFNCFDNTEDGRLDAMAAIFKAQYLNDLTYTGATAKCICDELLQSSCGIPNTDCLDVVFITDGYSNDPGLKVCDEIKCLHNRMGVNTFAIGINGYNDAELECISHYSNSVNIFKYKTFGDFKASIDEITQAILDRAVAGDQFACTVNSGKVNGPQHTVTQ